jgi:putative ABC transport system ATP-binding protein
MAVKSLYLEPEVRRAEIEWPALELNDVFKIYRSGPVETVALRGVDLKVDRGEFVAILGPSGCGKSTLLALAAGLDRPTAGEVRAFGESLSALGEDGLAAYRATKVGIVFQSGNLWPTASAAENIAIALRLAGLNQVEVRTRDALRAVGLGNRSMHRTAALSGGEQQRVAIAAVLARRAPLLLADEPTGELDAASERLVLGALRQVQAGGRCSVVVVTHSEAVAAEANRVVELGDGAVVP